MQICLFELRMFQRTKVFAFDLVQVLIIFIRLGLLLDGIIYILSGYFQHKSHDIYDDMQSSSKKIICSFWYSILNI